MNKKINIDKDTMKLLYSKYKEYLFPLGIILLCIIIFAFVIIPQIQNIFELQSQEKEEAKRLEVMQSNYNLLSSMSSSNLDSKIKIVSRALPTEKDFIGILTGVEAASKKANVILENYSFQVGDLAKIPANVKGVPSIPLDLTVNGNITKLASFIKELENTLPLSEVKVISSTRGSSTIEAVFYYKPLPKQQVKDDIPLSNLSSDVEKLIDDLSRMNNSQSLSNEDASSSQGSSPSAIFSAGN